MIDVVQVMATLAAMVVVIGGGAGAVIWIRKWIAGVATAAKESAKQLATSNGHTIGQYVEQTAGQLAELRQEIHVLTEWAGDNRTQARQAATDAAAALAVAQRAHDRLDQLFTQMAAERPNSRIGGAGG